MKEFSILIIDEYIDNHKVLAETLRHKARSLIHLTCTREAEKLISEQPVDMIILDTGNGNNCGINFMRRVFKNRESPTIPVFMMSLRDDLSTKLMSYTSGALRFFSKPIDVEELVGSVSRFENKRKECYAL